MTEQATKGGELEPQIDFKKPKIKRPYCIQRTSNGEYHNHIAQDGVPALGILPQKSQNTHAEER